MIGSLKKKTSIPVLCALLFALCSSVGAQQSAKIPRVAYLTAAPLAAMVERTNAFRQGLRELGYVEGKNILIELRSSEGRLDTLRGIADELVRMKVDVIVTGGGGVTGPVKDATSTIPVVMAQDSDPVGNRFVVSLSRPEAILLDYPISLRNLSASVSRFSKRSFRHSRDWLPSALQVTATMHAN